MDELFGQLRVGLDREVLRIMRDRVFEANEREGLRLLRGDVELGPQTDTRQFIEQELMRVKRHELERIKAKQGILLQKEVEKKILKNKDVEGALTYNASAGLLNPAIVGGGSPSA